MKKRDIAATSLGNILEWFDFGLFIFLAPIIGQQFFPIHDPATASIAAFSVFAGGFLARPLGGIFFGHRGDTRGRAKTLRLSILIITTSTLLIGFLPTYEQAGILAPILFALLRLAQGVSVGGEYSGVMIYLAESAPAQRRGFITSFAAIGANIGFLLATLTAILLKNCMPEAFFQEWGWRLPFIAVGGLGSLVLYYRLRLSETPTYEHLRAQHHIEQKPFWSAVRFAPGKLMRILGITCMSSTFYYVFFGYMPDYLEQYIHLPANTALTLQSILLAIMLFLVLVAGYCGDRFGRKRMLMITALGIILLSLPCFYLLQEKTLLLVTIALSLATVLSSIEQGNSLTTVVENCPADIRYSGVAFSYNLGMALFGGTAPLVVSVLTQQVHVIAPAYYLMAMAAISLIAILTLQKKVDIEERAQH